MSTIVTINASDLPSNSRADLNTNFSNLNTDKFETSNVDTDTALAANSDTKVPSQKAVKTYIDTQGGANASETVRGIVEEATDAEVTAGTATGGTGAKLIVTPAKLATRLASYQTTLTAKSGAATRGLDTASGTQNIAHGLSIAPKMVRITAWVDTLATAFRDSHGFSNGSATNSQYRYIYTASSTAPVINTSNTAFLVPDDAGISQYQSGVITMDATNIIITWTRVGTTNAGTIYLMWEAIA